MNENLQAELGRTLHQQADGISGAPISFEAVRGTAGRIRNRRRAMAAGAVLAVGAAIAVPSALMGGLGEDRGGTPPVVSPGDPTRTTEGKAAEGLTLEGLEQGDAPRIAWLEGTTLHRADGSEATLPKPYLRVAPFSDDYWVAVDGRHRVDLLADDGMYVVDTWQALEHAPLVTNADGSNVGWMGADGQAMVLDEGVIVPEEIGPFDYGTQLVAITGDCGSDAGCRLWTNFSDAGGHAFMVTSSDGSRGESASRSLLSGADVTSVPDGRLMIGTTELRMDSSCSGLTGPQEDTPTWTTCDFTLDEFSPDGRHVLAGPTWRSGIGDGELAILSATGTVRVALSNDSSAAFYSHAVWEDDEHVLVTIFEGGRWAMVRVGVDGSREYAVAPQPGGEMETPYFLSARP